MNTTRGAGGELHQQAEAKERALTTNQGTPISDDQNSLRSGSRGATLLEDFVLREKITHFDHERIPERVVHARGYGAHGTFQAYRSHADITRAGFLQDPALKTPVFVRFSTVAGSEGSADTVRDVRGFAVKFYTQEGNFDLVGNNIPVFFIQDAMKFPDLVHAAKQEPDRGFPQAATAHDTFWDFVSLTPESVHMLMWAMSDRAIPRSFRTMEGFGVHTFRMIDAGGRSHFVKFHWRPLAGAFSLIWDEAVKIAGADPDFHRRDLWEAIASGNFPEYELSVQVFDEHAAQGFGFDVLDATKLIPEELVPLRPLGKLVLDRNVDSFFAETEQVAFCPSHLVPGIDFSDDPLLQGRVFSYLDTQLSRLGSANFHELPINRPKCPWHNLQRDAQMRSTPDKGRVAYEPSSLAPQGPRESPQRGFETYTGHEQGPKVRKRSESFSDHYTQARMFWLSMTAPEQKHIVNGFAFELGKVETAAIRRRMLGHLHWVHLELEAEVAKALGMQGESENLTPAVPPKEDVAASPALSLLKKAPETLHGKRVGLLVTNGTDDASLAALQNAIEEAGGVPKLIAPTIGGITTAAGTRLEVAHALSSAPSVLFDAIALLPSQEGALALLWEAAAVDFARDAFGHLKAIGYNAAAAPLLDKANVERELDAGVLTLDDPAAFVAAAKKSRFWQRENRVRTPG
jgi:catalase